MNTSERLNEILQSAEPAKLVDFDVLHDRILPFDFTAANKELTESVFADTGSFSVWINDQLKRAGARYGIGGYNELRTIYNRSEHFDTAGEPRRLHLGVDIWGPAGTLVYSPFDAAIHSFNYNETFGDYGATIILRHQLEEVIFHTLYGHLNLEAIQHLRKGDTIKKGEAFAEFGDVHENGNWPPHLHFQLILDMEGKEGDYPGVCTVSERDLYLQNCPDPEAILRRTFKKLSC